MNQKELAKIIAFLCSVPPESNLRLMLQLALAVSVPDEKYETLLLPLLKEKQTLLDLLENKNLLVNLLEADGHLDEAEQNMLFEAMEQVGLIVPMQMNMIDTLTQELSVNLVDELEEIKTSSSVGGKPLLWSD